MKVFLSGLEASGEFEEINKRIPKYKYILCSFYYLRQEIFETILSKSDLMLIDSGAHSFQKGKKVDWLEYTRKYAQWIKENDCDKILGYFEMDVDNLIGYERVLELRKILESVTVHPDLFELKQNDNRLRVFVRNVESLSKAYEILKKL